MNVIIPESQHIERKGNGYYVAGTRISLDSIAYAVGRGETVDQILSDFPALQSREKLESVVAFVQAHPREVNAYLADTAQRWEEARKLNAPDLVEKASEYRKARDLKLV